MEAAVFNFQCDQMQNWEGGCETIYGARGDFPFDLLLLCALRKLRSADAFFLSPVRKGFIRHVEFEARAMKLNKTVFVNLCSNNCVVDFNNLIINEHLLYHYDFFICFEARTFCLFGLNYSVINYLCSLYENKHGAIEWNHLCLLGDLCILFRFM